MKSCRYVTFILGETPERISRLHHSSVTRLKAFAIAIHIPIALWAVTGFVIASQTFQLDNVHAGAVALFLRNTYLLGGASGFIQPERDGHQRFASFHRISDGGFGRIGG